MDRIAKLVQVLKRLNAGEAMEGVRKDAQELLNDIDPTELSIAEQSLLEQGMDPQDLRGLCTIHMEMLKGELEALRASVEPGHPLHTLIAEHDVILDLLQKLEKLNHEVQEWHKATIDPRISERLNQVAEGLVSAEKHHEREEEVLFPELEQLGITGPPMVMRLEHDDLRPRKKKLLDLAQKAHLMDLETFKQELSTLSRYIVFNLRDHIFKENHILYPSAKQNIVDADKWNEMRKACDAIGYCSFTPIVLDNKAQRST